MHDFDVVGYVVNECELICEDCLGDDEPDDSPVFAGSETDVPNHCERCGELISQDLTTDGAEYVRESVWAGDGDPEVLALWASEFDFAFPNCECCGESLNTVGIGNKIVTQSVPATNPYTGYEMKPQTVWYCNAECYNECNEPE